MSAAYINNDKTMENEINTKQNKSEIDLENLIKTKNLKNINIFKTNNTQLNINIRNETHNKLIENSYSNTFINKNIKDFSLKVLSNDQPKGIK